MRETVTLVGGEVLTNVHPASGCDPEPCPIHRPSDHHMVTWRQHYRWSPDISVEIQNKLMILPGDSRQIMERVCEHGVGHPDPDDYRVRYGLDSGDHGCDFCCSQQRDDDRGNPEQQAGGDPVEGGGGTGDQGQDEHDGTDDEQGEH